ncbi:NnrS family protein [Thalassotalea fonticola]|uniref:NnrS family protein n=1 Tax=Thalassotalea fonticola TaxID=3065649 RepID=A0ABZ0GSH2_9GAMM|nr:NnrS family protein [Colwelliaceae bacterium S1-1]
MTTLLNIDNSPGKAKKQALAFFELAFRPFFLLASLFSIIALLAWSAILNGNLNLNVYGGSFWWHTHEMLFGFVAAIIVGFLLTAVQNWTGVQSIHGKSLALLVCLWLVGRALFLFPAVVPVWLIAFVDIMFLPISAVALARPIIKVKLWRNLMFIPILLVMTLANITMHYSVIEPSVELMTTASTTMVLLVTLVMCIMGGRVFPMFTANGTQTARVNAIPLLEKIAIISTLLALIISLNLIKVPALINAIIFFIAAAAHVVRAYRWKIWVTLKTPLVWSLHLSYWCIALGLLLFGLAELTATVTHSQAVHTLTVGAMGTMILSMISRVSLGHTGRAIIASKVMTVAFIAIISAVIIRVFGSYWFSNYNLVINFAVVLWTIAYGSFVVLYFPILTKPNARN